MKAAPVGLFADAGEFSVHAHRRLSARRPVVVFSFGPVPFEGPSVHTVPPGDIAAILAVCARDSVREMVVVGKIPPEMAFSAGLHASGREFLGNVGSWRPETVLKGLAGLFAARGVRLLSLARVFRDDIARERVYTRREPDGRERADIAAGMAAARRLTALRIGQTLTVARGMIVAVEAAEGTDLTIERSGRCCKGFVVVKAAGRSKDVRFDLPTVGPGTIRAMGGAGGAVLAVESGRTIIVNGEETVAACDRLGIALVGVRPGAPARTPASGGSA